MIYIDTSGELKEDVESDMCHKIAMLKDKVIKRKSVDQQRDNLLRFIAGLLGIDNTEFEDFLNS